MAKILITRADSEPLEGLLVAHGLDTAHLPLTRLVPTHHPAPDGRPHVVLVTSAAVTRFAPTLPHHTADARVVAVGEATSTALLQAGVQVFRVGDEGGVKALALAEALEGAPCWYVGAADPSTALAEALDHAGFVRWPVYRNERVCHSLGIFQQTQADLITFCSGSAVRSYVAGAGLPNVPVVVLGPSTHAVARELGVQVTAVAAAPTLKALATAVLSSI
jgi:uroporphyrinogen-III synthase